MNSVDRTASDGGRVDFARSKYKSWPQFYKKVAVRAVLRAYLRTLLKWEPLEDPEPGYSVVIACNYNLRGILDANLQLIAKQDVSNMKALFVAFETTEREFPRAFIDDTLRRYPHLPIEFLFYDAYQSKGLRTIDWPWTYAWLSWCKATALCRTRYLLLHDYDALPVRRDFFEDRYRLIREGGQVYLGCDFYRHNWITTDDKLAATWELMFDVCFVRRRFRPVDIFNVVRRYGDRLLEFDTFLDAQKRDGTTSVVVAEVPGELVHLSQVISQHTQVLNGRQKSADNLLFVPYMLFVSGSPRTMEEMTETLKDSAWLDLVYFGKTIKTPDLDWARAEWITRHIRATELSLNGEVRPAVEGYCDALFRYVGTGGERSKVPHGA